MLVRKVVCEVLAGACACAGAEAGAGARGCRKTLSVLWRRRLIQSYAAVAICGAVVSKSSGSRLRYSGGGLLD